MLKASYAGQMHVGQNRVRPCYGPDLSLMLWRISSCISIFGRNLNLVRWLGVRNIGLNKVRGLRNSEFRYRSRIRRIRHENGLVSLDLPVYSHWGSGLTYLRLCVSLLRVSASAHTVHIGIFQLVWRNVGQGRHAKSCQILQHRHGISE